MTRSTINQYAVIVDFSHLFHVCRAAALNAGPAYDLHDTTVENVIGKLRTVKRALAKMNIVGYDLVFAEDRPATRKLNLLPGYRAGRKQLTDEKEALKAYLLQKGHITRFCFSEGNEADDVIASLVRLVLEQESLCSVVVSGDRDLWQLMGGRTAIFNPVNLKKPKVQAMRAITEQDVLEAFKCRPIHVPLVKALWGDYGDCVPNVVPRAQKHLYPLIYDSDGTLDSFAKQVEEKKWYLPTEVYYKVVEVWPDISRNYQLVKLDDDCELVWQ